MLAQERTRELTQEQRERIACNRAEALARCAERERLRALQAQRDETMARGRGAAGGAGGGGGSSSSAKLGSVGASESWTKYKANVKKSVGAFLLWVRAQQASNDEEVKAKYPVTTIFPTTLDEISAEQACCMELYDWYATWLCKEYKTKVGKNKEQPLKEANVINYLNCFLNLTCAKFRHVNDKTKLFFTCRDDCGTDESQWLQGLRMNVHREVFSRTVKSGEPQVST